MKNNLLKYLVIAALLVNAATLVFFWIKRSPRNDRQEKETFDVIIHKLKLDNNQQIVFKNLRQQHHHSHDSLLQIIAEKRQVLYAQKSVSMDSTLQAIGLLQQQIELVTYQHFENLRKICTPEQQTKLDKMLVGAVQHVLMSKGDKPPPPQNE